MAIREGDNGPNSLNGTGDDDVIRGRGGQDDARGFRGDDSISGGNGRDDLDGGRGRDMVRGNNGEDDVAGNRDGDQVFGGADADLVRGGRGFDRVDGGQGADDLRGGTGADRFVFDDRDTGLRNSGNLDVVRDFDRGDGDVIDLRPVNLNGFASNDATPPLGRWSFVDQGNDTLVVWNTNASGGTRAVLVEDADLNLGDFIIV